MSSTPLGPPPGYETIVAQMDEAKQRFDSFTSAATELHHALTSGDPIPSERIGGTLDQARAWITYLSAGGPLTQAIPPQAAPQISMGFLTQIAAWQRTAQQWVDYLEPAWKEASTRPQTLLRDEESCLRRIQEADQDMNQRTAAISRNSGLMSSDQVQAAVNDLYGLLGTLQSWQSTTESLLRAGRPACSQRLGALKGSLQSRIQSFEFTVNSKRAFEASQGSFRSFGSPVAVRPGPGSPEWFGAVTGLNCYWCGCDFAGLMKPVVLCPVCHLVPTPS
jgi:hypothetical protein